MRDKPVLLFPNRILELTQEVEFPSVFDFLAYARSLLKLTLAYARSTKVDSRLRSKSSKTDSRLRSKSTKLFVK